MIKRRSQLGETFRNELETTKDNLGETTTDLEFTNSNQLLGSAGVVRKGLPRNAKDLASERESRFRDLDVSISP